MAQGKPNAKAPKETESIATGTRNAKALQANDDAQKAIEDRCPICLDEVQDPFITECAHRFCGTCIKRALGMKKETTAFSSCGKLGLATKRSPAVEEGAA